MMRKNPNADDNAEESAIANAEKKAMIMRMSDLWSDTSMRMAKMLMMSGQDQHPLLTRGVQATGVGETEKNIETENERATESTSLLHISIALAAATVKTDLGAETEIASIDIAIAVAALKTWKRGPTRPIDLFHPLQWSQKPHPEGRQPPQTVRWR
jgi:hypothetical protein